MKFFDLFSGCGGFRLGLESAGFKCVGHCEINKHAKFFYDINFNTQNEDYYNDATTINTSTMPDFDILVAGFPCQSFSIAGKRRGFKDTRGSLFFDVARILKNKKPKYFLLENVKGLLNHNGGRTFGTIIGVLANLGYRVEWQVLNSKFFGVPQNRERVFIVGRFGKGSAGEIFPLGGFANENTGTGKELTEIVYWKNSKEKWVKENRQNTPTLKTQSELCRQPLIYQSVRKKISGGANEYSYNNVVVGTLRTYKDSAGFRKIKGSLCPTIPARAREDGSGQPVIAIPVLTPGREKKRQNGRRFKKNGDAMFTLTAQDTHGVLISDTKEGGEHYRIRRLTPMECFRLQGFPDYFVKKAQENGISDAQLYKMAGNSVTVNVVAAIAKKIKKADKNG